MRVFREVLRQTGLEMKPVSAELVFDGSRMVFAYEAEGRPDLTAFRDELRRRLARRVELRSVGPRECARLCGDHGLCGGAALLSAFPFARAADHAADGEGPGPADELRPHHRPLRAPALLPRLRASDVQELPRPRAEGGPAGRDASQAAES